MRGNPGISASSRRVAIAEPMVSVCFFAKKKNKKNKKISALQGFSMDSLSSYPVVEIDGKGNGAVATEEIKKGQLLLSCDPFVAILDDYSVTCAFCFDSGDPFGPPLRRKVSVVVCGSDLFLFFFFCCLLLVWLVSSGALLQ
jgi:hypothetical protein